MINFDNLQIQQENFCWIPLHAVLGGKEFIVGMQDIAKNTSISLVTNPYKHKDTFAIGILFEEDKEHTYIQFESLDNCWEWYENIMSKELIEKWKAKFGLQEF